MIVNRTTVSKKDLEFVSKHRCKEPRIAFAILVVALCGAFNLILGGIRLYNAVFSGGSVDVVTVTISFVLGVLFILWSIFFQQDFGFEVTPAAERKSPTHIRVYGRIRSLQAFA